MTILSILFDEVIGHTAQRVHVCCHLIDHLQMPAMAGLISNRVGTTALYGLLRILLCFEFVPPPNLLFFALVFVLPRPPPFFAGSELPSSIFFFLIEKFLSDIWSGRLAFFARRISTALPEAGSFSLTPPPKTEWSRPDTESCIKVGQIWLPKITSSSGPNINPPPPPFHASFHRKWPVADVFSFPIVFLATTKLVFVSTSLSRNALMTFTGSYEHFSSDIICCFAPSFINVHIKIWRMRWHVLYKSKRRNISGSDWLVCI